MKFAGRAAGVKDLSQVLDSRITATAETDDLLRADVEAASLRSLRAVVSPSAAVELANLAPLLPARCSTAFRRRRRRRLR